MNNPLIEREYHNRNGNLITPNGRECSKCNEFKPWNEYYKGASQSTGYTSRCVSCYGTKKQYNNLIVNDSGRECSSCYEFKPWSEYAKNSRAKFGYMPQCKKCLYKGQRCKEYNISAEEYDALFELSEGKCMICSEKAESLSIDHDHETGQVRGLLCSNCNAGLGMFQDDPSTLRLAALYLEKVIRPFS